MSYKCPICGGNVDISACSNTSALYYYRCENGCGFFAPDLDFNEKTDEISYYNYSYDRNKLKSYLSYHKSNLRPILLSQEDFLKIDTSGFVKIYNLTPEMVENWYPKTFAEKIDYILLRLNKETDYDGEELCYNLQELQQICFTINKDNFSENDIFLQVDYILNYLKNENYILLDINKNFLGDSQWYATLTITPEGLSKIYELQKNQESNKNVFVAMKFGKETEALRDKIKEGLAGYSVRIMDEIEHNHQIIPEMLYEIKNSKFVIAELSHHNNGAYYEAGYALGLGKEVIHICSESELKSGLHFDVAQVNTITYKDVNEIPEKLKKRIHATIENK